jgi:hypothetical protein
MMHVDCRYENLRLREQGLLERPCHGMHGQANWCVWAGSLTEIDRRSGTLAGQPFDFRRGFVATVRGPLAALLEHLPRMGLELGLVERAEPTDKYSLSTTFDWFRGGPYDVSPLHLPPDVFDAMANFESCRRGNTRVYTRKRYATEAVLRDALSDAILAVCWKRAGLVQSTST